MNANEIEAAVDQLLCASGVQFMTKYVKKTSRWGSDVDRWQVIVTGKLNNTEDTYDFYTGVGHREKLEDGTSRPKLPNPTSILYCLISDSYALDMEFEDWCDNTGCNKKSRRDYDIYQQCRNVGEKLQRTFTPQQLEELTELLQDY